MFESRDSKVLGGNSVSQARLAAVIFPPINASIIPKPCLLYICAATLVQHNVHKCNDIFKKNLKIQTFLQQ